MTTHLLQEARESHARWAEDVDDAGPTFQTAHMLLGVCLGEIERLRDLLRLADRYTGHDHECDEQLPRTEQCICGFHDLDSKMVKELLP